MSLPKRRSQPDGLLIGRNGTRQISICVQRNTHVVIGVGIVAVERQRLAISVHRSLILTA